jgi:uncharacterized protein (DUF1697 family)
MNTYISILRGINVSGKNIIKMEALRNVFIYIGFSDVKTYIQSGNIIFKFKKASPQKLAVAISSVIKKEFNYEVPVLVLEITDIETVISNNPFLNKPKQDEKNWHVTFLEQAPDKALIAAISTTNFAPDEFKIIDKAVYLSCPNGYGNTKLNNTFFEKKLKTTATTRNWKTVNELLKLAIT